MESLRSNTFALAQATPTLLSAVGEVRDIMKDVHTQYTKSLEITELSLKMKLVRQLRSGTRTLQGKNNQQLNMKVMFSKKPGMLSTILLDFLEVRTNNFYEFLLTAVNHKDYGKVVQQLVDLLLPQECR